MIVALPETRYVDREGCAVGGAMRLYRRLESIYLGRLPKKSGSGKILGFKALTHASGASLKPLCHKGFVVVQP
jgi:hypothetical protein